MHRLPKAAGLGAVMLSLLVVFSVAPATQARQPSHRYPLPAVPAARAWTPDAEELARTAPQAVRNGTTAQSCTGWRSTLSPPATIRVLRTMGPNVGHVEEVDFPTYVLTVFGAEWPAWYPVESLRAGAIAVKQYGWYYTIVYRGGVDADGICYDVQDNTKDQYYQPELRTPTAKHAAAQLATWPVTLRKYKRTTHSSVFFLTGYRAGANQPCGADRDGYRLYQKSVYACGMAKMTYRQILHLYLDPYLEIVVPGAHDIVGNDLADASVLVDVGDATLAPRVYSTSSPKSIGPAGQSTLLVDATGLRGSISVDLGGDGFEDLLTLHSTGDTTLRLDVARSDGSADYLPQTVWWEGDLSTATAEARLVSGDFNADGRRDAGVLLPGTEPGTTILRMFKQNAGRTAFGPPTTWWSGPLDLPTARAWAADLDGDGRADMLVRQDLGDAGIRFLSAVSDPTGGPLGELKPKLDAPDLLAAKTMLVQADADRDGRDDLWIIYAVDTGVQVDLLRSFKGKLIRTPRWTSPATDPMPFGKLKAAGGDVNGDGMGDLVLYRDRAENGTTIVMLRSTYAGLVPTATLDDPTLDWSAARPY